MMRWFHRADTLVGWILEEEHAFGGTTVKECDRCRWSGGGLQQLWLDIEPELKVVVEAPICWMSRYVNTSRWLAFIQMFEEETGLAVWREGEIKYKLENRNRREAWPDPILDYHWNSRWYLARSFAGRFHKECCEKCSQMTHLFASRLGRNTRTQMRTQTRHGADRGQVPSPRSAYRYKRLTHPWCRKDIQETTLEGLCGHFLSRRYSNGNWIVPQGFEFPPWFDWEGWEERENERREKHLLAQEKKRWKECRALLTKARKKLRGETSGNESTAGQEASR